MASKAAPRAFMVRQAHHERERLSQPPFVLSLSKDTVHPIGMRT